MKQFWDKNKVFILGLLGAVVIAVKAFQGSEEIKWSAVALAAGLAALSYIAKEWRGQGMSIIGIIGVAAETVYTLYQGGLLTWDHAIFNFLLAIATTALPDPKSRGYENSEVIKQAKAEGESITPAKLTTKPKV